MSRREKKLPVETEARLTAALAALQEAEAKLAARERWYRELLDAIPAAIYTTDAEGRITYYNRAASELAGTTPVLGVDQWCVTWRLFRPDGQPLPHEECPMAIALRENRAVRGAEAVAERPDGTRVPFIPYPTPLRDASGALIGAVNMLVDTTASQEAERDRQRLLTELQGLNATLEQRVEERTRALLAESAERRAVEEQLHQLQKTEALGQLTGGIAHDFNNILTAVMGNIDFIAMKATDPAVQRHAEIAGRAAQRGANLTQQLLAFSRKQRLEAKPTDINDLVAGMSEILVRALGGTSQIELALDQKLWPALIDANQIESAVLNLAINARDAMAGGGTLTIETSNLRIGQQRRAAELEPGDYVMVAVTDTGCGMSDEVKAKACDPFFTLKDVGKGSGLGLSQVYGVARQSSGDAEIESAIGRGTTVRMYLPRAQGVALAPARDEPRRLAAAAARRNTRVLVIDDDDDVRDVMTRALKRLGCKAIAARSASEGLAALERHRFALVILDFAMPGMNGAHAADMIRARRPGLPILHVSGYPTGGIGEAQGDRFVLRKPFAMADLEAKVRSILDGPVSPRRTNVVPIRAVTG